MAAAALPPEALAKMAFLAGHWRCERDDMVLEEVWLAPAGGVAQGSVRLLRGGKVGAIELIVAAAEGDRVVMRYNHFHSDYRTWESDGPITLTLTRADDAEVVFTNLNQPPRHAAEMGYRSGAPDQLTSWVVTLEGPGAPERLSFDFRRIM